MTLQWGIVDTAPTAPVKRTHTPKHAQTRLHKHTHRSYRVNLDRPSLLSCLLIVAATLAVLTPIMALVVWHTRGAGW